MKTKVQVKDLRAGDVLTSGAVITDGPFSTSSLPTKLVKIGVLYPNGRREMQNWNKYTTVTVINRNPVTV